MAQSEKEMLLSVDAFKEPVVVEGKDAIALMLLRLIWLEPGTISSRPEMGVGLLSNYKNCDEAKAFKLKDHIRKQIRTYFPKYQGVEVQTKLNPNGVLMINITIDGTMYVYETEQDTTDNRIVGIHSIMQN